VAPTAAAALFAGVGDNADPDPIRSTRQRMTILVVDNDPVLLTLIARSLTLSGYRVLEAERGAEALELARRHAGPVDLLLTDVMMPGMNGFEVADVFRHLHPEAKVLYMSGHIADVAGVRDAFETHRDMFLVKPFWFEALLEKIESILPGDSTS
jgi:CheY-like chemotaxis protein